MILPDSVLQDLRYGARMLRRHIGFTLVSIFALALGIGVNSAVFTAYKALVSRPIDGRDPGRMVNLASTRQSGAADFRFSYPDYEAFRDSVHAFSGLIAFRLERMTLSDAAGSISQRPSAARSTVAEWMRPPTTTNAEFAGVYAVSKNYFKILGVSALRGRTFELISDPELLATPAVLISENSWQTRFAGDPAVLGKIIRLNGVALHIAGITPHDFVGTGVGVPDFWLPFSLEPLVHGDDNWLRDRENQCCRLFGRLAPAVSINQAQAEMNLVADHLRALHDPHSDAAKPATALVWPASPFPLPLRFYAGLRLTIVLVILAAAMLLVVACANTGSLQLARARSRQNELHTRLSLGASRFRVIRQLLTESALLGIVAGIIALLFAWAFLRVMIVLASHVLPSDAGTLIFYVSPDLEIFAFVLAVSLLSAILFGLAPAVESSRSALSSGVRASTSPVSTRRLQNMLIAAQVSLSLVLIIAGTMLIHSSIHSLRTETGYDSKHLIDLDLQFPEASRYTPGRQFSLLRDLRTRLASLPEVADITSARPPGEYGFRTAALPLGEAGAAAHHVESILCYTYVQSNYFPTLGIALFLGRGFESHGQPERSVILSESAAKQLWPSQNPIGQRVRLGTVDERFHNSSELAPDGPAYQVVGVARDTRGVEFDGSDSRQVYLPLPEARLQGRPMLIRTRSNPAQVRKAMGPVISSVDPALVATSSTLEQMLRVSPPFIAASFAATIASSLGLLGLLLAMMGIYGTVSYIVTLRTREVGIRMAVGARKADILGLILRESTRPVLAGLLLGMFLAVGASYALRDVLYGLNTVDAISFIGVSALFFVVTLLAAYPPARRAMCVEPVVALRFE